MNGVFTLRNLRAGTYLDLSDGSSANGAEVLGCSKAAEGYEKHQQWRITPEGENYR